MKKATSKTLLFILFILIINSVVLAGAPKDSYNGKDATKMYYCIAPFKAEDLQYVNCYGKTAYDMIRQDNSRDYMLMCFHDIAITEMCYVAAIRDSEQEGVKEVMLCFACNNNIDFDNYTCGIQQRGTTEHLSLSYEIPVYEMPIENWEIIFPN